MILFGQYLTFFLLFDLFLGARAEILTINLLFWGDLKICTKGHFEINWILVINSQNYSPCIICQWSKTHWGKAWPPVFDLKSAVKPKIKKKYCQVLLFNIFEHIVILMSIFGNMRHIMSIFCNAFGNFKFFSKSKSFAQSIKSSLLRNWKKNWI